jgi:hypothetical protein
VKMNEPQVDDRLTSALRAVAADDEQLNASPAVQARLLVEVGAIARARRRRTRIVALAVAAGLVLAIATPVWRTWVRQPAPTRPAVVSESGSGSADEVSTDFFPLPYSNVPAPAGHMVRIQVPRAALASFGVPSFASGDDASPTVLADVVVGDDGLARAVRFVRVVGK